jgi:NADH-quinone oxidoreductase subunit G
MAEPSSPFRTSDPPPKGTLAPPPPPAAPGASKFVKLKIDGREVEVPPGTTILRAAQQLGIHSVPTFCYHPGLTVAGNCRICMVEASNSKKPVISCATPVAEGIEVKTASELAKKSREAVLELMLLNHPLDCPICDKAGECMLQDHTYDHGKGTVSRMVEQKVIKHTKKLGPTISIWGNRCIVCTRCVRFCDEISGTGELCVVERGDHSIIDVFPGRPIENSLAGNTVDICPVGALISQDFLYQARVWNMHKADSICAECSRGCNVEIQVMDNKVHRLMPRENREVNDWWMCDHGRFEYRYVDGERRVLVPRPLETPAATAGKRLAGRLRGIVERFGPQAVAGIASSFLSLEELVLFKKLFDHLGSGRLAALARPAGREEKFKAGFVISADKNPNRKGVERILGPRALQEGLAEVLDGVKRGEVKALLVTSNLPGFALPAEVVAALASVECAAVLLLEEDARLPASSDVIPATAWAEKDGTMINDDLRLQRLKAALAPKGSVRREIEVLQEALVELGERQKALSADGVFREMIGETFPDLAGLTHRELGKLGRKTAGGNGAGGGR